ncbi:unnamed protein product [Notodromas monacha]|uniref:Uncharacterized protein n=1 Tax=Notodromas monacha TaxID=399045 RepID=A0A7R9BPN9_9CRUS|nr:unnamed protein product [Notodromas monacha]CAG0918018.1 unnamed protein product [Notodromas monacha]
MFSSRYRSTFTQETYVPALPSSVTFPWRRKNRRRTRAQRKQSNARQQQMCLEMLRDAMLVAVSGLPDGISRFIAKYGESSSGNHQAAALQITRNSKLRDVFGVERPEEDRAVQAVNRPSSAYALIRTPPREEEMEPVKLELPSEEEVEPRHKSKKKDKKRKKKKKSKRGDEESGEERNSRKRKKSRRSSESSDDSEPRSKHRESRRSKKSHRRSRSGERHKKSDRLEKGIGLPFRGFRFFSESVHMRSGGRKESHRSREHRHNKGHEDDEQAVGICASPGDDVKRSSNEREEALSEYPKLADYSDTDSKTSLPEVEGKNPGGIVEKRRSSPNASCKRCRGKAFSPESLNESGTTRKRRISQTSEEFSLETYCERFNKCQTDASTIAFHTALFPGLNYPETGRKYVVQDGCIRCSSALSDSNEPTEDSEEYLWKEVALEGPQTSGKNKRSSRSPSVEKASLPGDHLTGGVENSDSEKADTAAIVQQVAESYFARIRSQTRQPTPERNDDSDEEILVESVKRSISRTPPRGYQRSSRASRRSRGKYDSSSDSDSDSTLSRSVSLSGSVSSASSRSSSASSFRGSPSFREARRITSARKLPVIYRRSSRASSRSSRSRSPSPVRTRRRSASLEASAVVARCRRRGLTRLDPFGMKVMPPFRI